MKLIYPINCVGHDEWLNSGYNPTLAKGDVVTSDGELLGTWRAVGYDKQDEYPCGRFEFVPYGEKGAKIVEAFAMLDARVHRGFALSQFSRAILEWHESQ